MNLSTSHLETLTAKLIPGELTLLAGRPGAGSSLLAMHLAIELGMRQRRPVDVYTNCGFELNRWATCMARMAAPLSFSRFVSRSLNAQELSNAVVAANALNDAPITVHRNVFISPELLPTYLCETLPNTPRSCLILVEFFQWDDHQHRKHEQHLAGALLELKQLAQAMKLSVLVLSGLRRSVDMRENKRPRLSDLPGKFLKHQAVDQVWLLYRHGLYVKDPAALTWRVELTSQQLHMGVFDDYQITWDTPDA